MAFTLTAANSILLLSVTGLYSTPQQIQGYSADDAFDVDNVTRAEVLMGVDGRKSAGYVPVVKTLNLSLQADSSSMSLFETWAANEDTNMEVLTASGSIALPAVGCTYALNNGTLMGFSPLPGVRKILQPRKFSIVFESIVPSPF
jgi:hypothetical protein